MTKGLFPGRFLTFHQGHKFAADLGIELSDELTILVLSSPEDPINAKKRAEWISKTVPAEVAIANAPTDWRGATEFKSIIGQAGLARPDLLVGGFQEIANLAKAVDAEPLVVDRPREVFDLSSAEVLESPETNWSSICPAARIDLQKRICLVGPESVGKSVACEMLAKRFQTRVIPEFGRNYEEDLMRGADWTERDFVTLSMTHIAWANQIALRSGPVVFEDTEIIQTMVWAEHMMGYVPKPMFELEKERKAPDLYLILAPDVDWVDDGTRYAGAKEVRTFFFDRLVHHIQGLGHRAVIISGADYKHREAQILDAVASVCG